MTMQSPPLQTSAAEQAHRAAATLSSIQCTNCGAALDLRGFGATSEVHCLHCGSRLREDENGALAVVQAARRARRPSMLPLHAFGEIAGQRWQIIGIVWRKTEYEGIVFPWQEFLLFNPYLGYRWLIYSMSDPHWTLGRSLEGAPREARGVGRPRLHFGGHKYKHFQNSVAQVVYVEGEFPWRVQAEDEAEVDDFVRGRKGVSIERSGTDLSYTELEHIDGQEVWAAFGREGSPPKPLNIGPLQPNPYAERKRSTWLCFAGLLALWFVAAVFYGGTRASTQLLATDVKFRTQGQVVELISQELDIGTPGARGNVEFFFHLTSLDNDWAYARLMLINTATEQAIEVGVEVDEWHGVSAGERWREGSGRATAIAAAVPGGHYLVQVLAQNSPKKGHVEHRGQIRIRSDVPLLRYVFLSLALILLIPVYDVMANLFFEGRRWQHSDYGPSSS